MLDELGFSVHRDCLIKAIPPTEVSAGIKLRESSYQNGEGMIVRATNALSEAPAHDHPQSNPNKQRK